MKKLTVHYGIRKVGGIIKNPSICVWYENANNNPAKNEGFVRRAMHLCYTREQTELEQLDSKGQHRMFSCYEMYFQKKPYNGNWYLTLNDNSLKDQFNVSQEERDLIYQSLEKKLKELYPIPKQKPIPLIQEKQLTIQFFECA